MNCLRKLEHWKKPWVPNMSHWSAGLRTFRKTTSSVQSFRRTLGHSSGCVRGKSRKSERQPRVHQMERFRRSRAMVKPGSNSHDAGAGERERAATNSHYKTTVVSG